jgi:hypothetical protein
MPVMDANKDYQDNLQRWRIVRDCCEGEIAIKNAVATNQDNSTGISGMRGSAYLPVPNASDISPENQQRYKDYLKRANYANYTGHTKEALLGMVFKKKPEIKLATTVKAMEFDADGMGNSLSSILKRSVDEVLQVARQGLLLEYPVINVENATAEITDGLTPFIKSYPAETVINWRTSVINGRQRLVLIVLKEKAEISTDEFSSEIEDQYRVLMLDSEGKYIQRVYDKSGAALIQNEFGETDIVPKQANGKPWEFIPFVFLGAINNDPVPDISPLYDLAVVNVAHYRNSADFEESCFLVGQPTVALGGLTQHWVDEVLKGSVMLGSRAAIPLPIGGSASLLQASPNQMPMEAMTHKEKQMIQIGAKIITDAGAAETAEAARIKFAGQNSKLGTIVDNVEEAYNLLLNWSLLFTGGTGSCLVELNKEFYDKTMDPQLLMAQIQLLDRGVIAIKDIRDRLRSNGEIKKERTDDDIDNDIADTMPFGAA